MTNRAVLLEAFGREDPELSAAERETVFRFARDREVVEFFTEERGIGRRLIAHPHSTISWVAVLEGERRKEISPNKFTSGEIVGVRGTLPIGVFMVKASPRNQSDHSAIVSRRVLEEVKP